MQVTDVFKNNEIRFPSYRYTTLIREADGEDYQLNKFNQQRVQNFRFVLVTQVPFPPEDLLDKCYPISVIVSS